MRARRGARRTALGRRSGRGRHAGAPARPHPRVRRGAEGWHIARTVRPRRRVLSRAGVAALLLPVAVGAGAPAAPAPVETRADAILTRALSVTTADSTEPVASVTVLPESARERLRPESVARRGVPSAALRAYVAAEATMRVADASCRLRWSLLAGIGRVESRHGQAGGDRLGPMQFVPATWQVVGVDADGDDRRDPRDLDDAALAAAAYLCAGAGDLGTHRGARAAVLTYNRSAAYADLVVALSDAYRRQVEELPAVATAALPTGDGVTVGVGAPGQGVLVGGSDNVVAAARKHGAAGKQSSRTGAEQRSSERKRAVDRRGDARPATTTSPSRERDRARTARSGETPRSPAPRPSPTPARRPEAKRSPAPTTKPTPKPSPKPSPKPIGNPPAPVEATRTGTVESTVSGFVLKVGTQEIVLIGERDWGLENFVGLTVTVSGILVGENTLELTAAPVPAG
jgi:hypothetical protein